MCTEQITKDIDVLETRVLAALKERERQRAIT